MVATMPRPPSLLIGRDDSVVKENPLEVTQLQCRLVYYSNVRGVVSAYEMKWLEEDEGWRYSYWSGLPERRGAAAVWGDGVDPTCVPEVQLKTIKVSASKGRVRYRESLWRQLACRVQICRDDGGVVFSEAAA